MKINKRYIVTFFVNLLWLLVGASCITLLVAAVHSKEAKVCKGVEINISGVSNNFFIDKTDVYNIIKNFGGDSTQKKSLASIDLGRIEKALEKDVWIKNAELYFDNNNLLKVWVEEREPIARLFTLTGITFYIDKTCMILPLSDKFSARLPIFTGFTSDAKILSPNDSLLLCSIKNMSIKILADTFLMAMIDQIDVNANRSFELVPKLGKQRIIFGDAIDVDTKFNKLKMFYKSVITQSGWNRYSSINLQYKNQVVATISGKEDIVADSLRTLQLIKFIAEDAAKKSADSSQVFLPEADKRVADSSLIQQSMEREEESLSSKLNYLPASTVSPIMNATAVVKPLVPLKMPVLKPESNQAKLLANKPVKKQLVNKKIIVKTALKPKIKNPVIKENNKPNNEY